MKENSVKHNFDHHPQIDRTCKFRETLCVYAIDQGRYSNAI